MRIRQPRVAALPGAVSEPVPAVPSAHTAREPLWTREYTLTVASLHLFFLGWATLFATLPLYLEDARKWQVGWVVGGAFGVASLLVRPASGRLTDRWGRRPVMGWGGALTAVTLAAHGLTDSPLLLTPIRLLNGVGMCLYTTAALAMLADALPPSRRGEGMGWYGVLYTTTNIYGPWLGSAIADVVGLPAFFVVAGAITGGAGLLALPLREAARPAVAGAARLISRAALLPTATFMTLTMTFSVLPAFLALYAYQDRLGRPGVYFFLLGLALVPARWFGGLLADRLGRPAVILPGLALAAAGMLLLALAQSAAMLYAAALVFGVGFGLGHTGLTILTVDRAGPHERGAAMATFALAWDFGTLGSFALGFVGDAVGFHALFFVAGLLPAAAGAGFAMALRAGHTARAHAEGDRTGAESAPTRRDGMGDVGTGRPG
jgi:MFS family permease